MNTEIEVSYGSLNPFSFRSFTSHSTNICSRRPCGRHCGQYKDYNNSIFIQYLLNISHGPNTVQGARVIKKSKTQPGPLRKGYR